MLLPRETVLIFYNIIKIIDQGNSTAIAVETWKIDLFTNAEYGNNLFIHPQHYYR